ncbi:MAG: low molecular weight protein arginine phosphatase [Clostridia bacterium]
MKKEKQMTMNNEKQSAFKNILFVCTGNTCRSCMAEGFFNNSIKKDDFLKANYISSSAGILAWEGEPANADSTEVMASKYGIDISECKARRISNKIIEKSQLILTMTLEHKDFILSGYPNTASIIFTLKEYANFLDINRPAVFDSYGFDVEDPYNLEHEIYVKCAEEISGLVDKVIKRLTDNSKC